jgi:hypothetical protein
MIPAVVRRGADAAGCDGTIVRERQPHDSEETRLTAQEARARRLPASVLQFERETAIGHMVDPVRALGATPSSPHSTATRQSPMRRR